MKNLGRAGLALAAEKPAASKIVAPAKKLAGEPAVGSIVALAKIAFLPHLFWLEAGR